MSKKAVAVGPMVAKIINKMILKDYCKQHKNLSIAQVDYKNAFNILPQSWTDNCFENYKIASTLQNSNL